MGRTRKWNNQADKQAMYRHRKNEQDFNNRQTALVVARAIAYERQMNTERWDGLPDWKVLEFILPQVPEWFMDEK